MTRTKFEHAENWIRLGEAAATAAESFNKLGREVEAHRHLMTSKYCYNRYLQSITSMLTRKQDKTLNILGAIFSIGVAALIVYLIINKK